MILTPHMQLLVHLWMGLWLLLASLYALLFVCYAWRVVRCIWRVCNRHLSCPWCWRAVHAVRWFPRRRSSNICAYHERHMLAQQAMLRAARLARARAALAQTVELEREVVL